MEILEFEKWLKRYGYDEGTIRSRIANCKRIEEFEGDLDNHYFVDEMNNLFTKLNYTSHDRRSNNLPHHRIPINGDVYNGAATLRAAAKLYHGYKIGNVKEIKTETTQKDWKILDHVLEIKDSYDCFFERFGITKEDLYDYGLTETIFPKYDQTKEFWNNLKHRVFNNGEVYIRGAGRDAKGTQIYIEFYEYLFRNSNIKKDPTNNFKPQLIIEELTGYKRNKNLFNYQVSHIYGRTKNPLMFEAPWNIAFVPKLIDPFTGHETKGKWPEEYQEVYLKRTSELYAEFIHNYNVLIMELEIEKNVSVFLNNIDKEIYTPSQIKHFEIGIKNELSKI